MREIHASAPAGDPEKTRIAYLELLKLAVCDLVGAGTETAYLSYDKTHVYRREPTDEELLYRTVGKDWPLRGLTMVGLTRLDDLQHCVESVVRDSIQGDLIEAGTWRGGASLLMRATLDSLGVEDRTVWLADSYQGFPTPDPETYPEDRGLDLSPHDFLSVPVEEVQSHFMRLGFREGLAFVPGFFDQTLPGLRGRQWSVIRLDGDTYESTCVGLESLYDGLSLGGYLVIDDYGFVPACRRAVEDFRNQRGITEPIEKVDWNCVRWRREREPESAPAGSDKPPGTLRQSDRGVGHRAYARVQTEREMQLEKELAALERNLSEARAELERLREA